MSKNYIKLFFKHAKWVINSVRDYFKFSENLKTAEYIFISHNGDSAGGAPVVLLELVKNCRNKNVLLLCKKPGKIMEACKDNGVLAYCTYFTTRAYLRKIAKSNVKVVLANTVATYDCVSYLQKRSTIHLIWWIHEETRLIKKYCNNIPQTIEDSVQIECVSKRVEDDLIEYCPQCIGHTEILFYGCTDLYNANERKQKNSDEFVITVIGRICARKNQLQIVEAFNQLPNDIKRNVRIDFVEASYEEDYLKLLQNAIRGKNIEVCGAIDRKEMKHVYEKSNLIVCCSVDDPLPVVVTEAMMLCCPVITSSKTGQYELIKNGVNGFAYDSDSTQELTNRIIDVYRKKYPKDLLSNERATYLKYFTPEVLATRFNQLVEET